MSRIAIYAGSFDPLTNGHADLIRRSLSFVDKLVVGVLNNTSKAPLFTVEERKALIHECIADPRVEVVMFRGLLVDVAREVGATLVIRGLRVVADFDYEMQMALTNRHLQPGLETIFMVPSLDTTYISSSLVKQVAEFHGDVTGLVPPAVAKGASGQVSPRRDPSVNFLAAVCARAAKNPRQIALAEADDTRVQEAAQRLQAEGIAHPLLVLDPAKTATHDRIRALGLPVVDPAVDPRAEVIAEALFASRSRAGLTAKRAADLSHDPLFFASGLVRLGAVDGAVAGAVRTTGDVVRSALWLVGMAPGVRTVSSAFYMVVRPFRGTEAEVLTFADCAVVEYPTAPQLADIAIAAAQARTAIVGDVPRVAFLSFSTRGSAGGASVEAIREAIALVQERDPKLAVSGELQGDAALIMDVATRKAPGDAVAGYANVLVFPSLDAGNIAYKLVERLAQAQAVGPILQGLAKPMADLSRGASSDDIVHVAAITALQAGST